MIKSKNIDDSLLISQLVVHGMQEKKGNDIVRLDLRNINSSVSDYFVICHAETATQMRALADSVEAEVFKGTKQNPWRVEGYANGEWILLDYVDVVVHVFKTDKRQYYGIEDLWGDAKFENYKSA
ncbi:MAG TPA: ribosome silencing factor [Sphingobacteriaceae bacterium]|nr:ribosome silencing factor [Sphingobacteriaceae bacterium]